MAHLVDVTNAERCHYAPHPAFGDAPSCGDVVGYLAEMRPHGFSWVRPVCAQHARSENYGHEPQVVIRRRADLRWHQICGAWRVVAARADGSPLEQRFCERVAGPCPYPNTPDGTLGDGRSCAEAVERHGTVAADALATSEMPAKRPRGRKAPASTPAC